MAKLLEIPESIPKVESCRIIGGRSSKGVARRTRAASKTIRVSRPLDSVIQLRLDLPPRAGVAFHEPSFSPVQVPDSIRLSRNETCIGFSGNFER